MFSTVAMDDGLSLCLVGPSGRTCKDPSVTIPGKSNQGGG